MAALFTPSFWMLLAIMALFQWISITFYMRTEMYREKTREYCLAASPTAPRTGGSSSVICCPTA